MSSQPTLTRLENGLSGRELDRLRDLLEQSYVASLAPSTSLVVLDIDSTDDPAHGAQEHGHRAQGTGHGARGTGTGHGDGHGAPGTGHRGTGHGHGHRTRGTRHGARGTGHGARAQEQVAFHGFYDPHMDCPLLVFDGETGQLVTELRRPGRAHAARSAATILERLLHACCRALAGAVRAHP